MTNLTPTTNTPAARTPVQRAAMVRQGLAQVYDTLLAVFDDFDTFGALYPDWRKYIYHPEIPTNPDSWPRRDRLIERAREELAALPPNADLDALAMRVSDLATAGPDRQRASLIVGLMIDAFPNARPHSPETYQETLVWELGAGGYPVAAVARACREIVKTKPFLPAIAEVLEEAEKANAHLTRMDTILEKACAKRDQAQAAIPVLLALKDLPERGPPHPVFGDDADIW